MLGKCIFFWVHMYNIYVYYVYLCACVYICMCVYTVGRTRPPPTSQKVNVLASYPAPIKKQALPFSSVKGHHWDLYQARSMRSSQRSVWESGRDLKMLTAIFEDGGRAHTVWNAHTLQKVEEQGNKLSPRAFQRKAPEFYSSETHFGLPISRT